jgi:uncharacterized membrane protein YdjX (TVP38/TMEM64 family)
MKRRAYMVLLCLAFLPLVWLLPAVVRNPLWSSLQDPQELGEWLSQWSGYVPLAVVLSQALQVLVAPIPGNVVSFASGYLLGVGRGTFYSSVGTAIGSLLAFALARAFGRPLAELWVPADTLARLDAGANRRGLFFFALVFLVPFVPDDLACLAAGLTSIPIPALMLAVLLCRPPGIFVSAWVGATATQMNAQQWAAVVVFSVLVAALFLRHGERLQALAMRLVEKPSQSTD